MARARPQLFSAQLEKPYPTPVTVGRQEVAGDAPPREAVLPLACRQEIRDLSGWTGPLDA